MPRKIQVQLPLFLDVIFADGDDVGGPSGTNIGETLPNWNGPDGKGQGVNATMIYVNKTLKAYSDEIVKRYLMPLFDEKLASISIETEGAGIGRLSRIFHNLGPRDKVKKPGSEETYGSKLTTASGVVAAAA